MSFESDALTSDDGTQVKVQKIRDEGAIRTNDEAALEVLQSIDGKLTKILSILEFEFELHGDDLNED